ncbi:carboxypeptidase family protein [Actinokineospora auranticolor]|uniref:Carboxypeptidase family protein n=1 Tax=Actinokineospora auranticolor TaxID=155976 RepID=A0A2S6GPU3_9PSEU|nr:carboxypeptidase family protein [Actinokineospora auranticolor]
MPPTTSGAPAEDLPDLRVSTEFGQPSYDIRDVAYLRLSVVNVGTAVARDITITTSGPVAPTWESAPTPWTIGPGATAERVGEIPLWALPSPGPLTVEVTVRASTPDATPSDNAAGATTTVTQELLYYQGYVFGDRNASEYRDPGEELAGASVTVTGGVPRGTYNARTGADGRFVFRDIPAGDYTIEVSQGTWRFDRYSGMLGRGGEIPTELRGYRPASEVLFASMRFDHADNHAATRVPLTVRLTNRANADLLVRAWCGLASGWGSEWGALNPNTPGAYLPANSTRDFPALVVIPWSAPVGSDFVVDCEFSIGRGEAQIVRASAATRTLSGKANLSGWVLRADEESSSLCLANSALCEPQPSGTRVPGVTLYLVDTAGRVVARAAPSNPYGGFYFDPVDPGTYTIGVVGPWRIVRTASGSPLELSVGDQTTAVWVEPGPVQPDPDQAPAPATPPVVPPRSTHVAHPLPDTRRGGPGDLARTGVDVVWSSVAGLLTVLLGVFLVRRGRRPAR